MMRRIAIRQYAWLCLTFWAIVAGPSEAGEISAVQAGQLRLALDRMTHGINVSSLFDVGAEQELLSDEKLPLFSLTVRDPNTDQLHTISADAGWNRADIAVNSDGRYKLLFAEPVESRFAGIRVEVTLEADDAVNALSWDLRVETDNARCALWKITFPQVSIRDLGGGAKVFFPLTVGIEMADAWSQLTRKGGTYPSGWTSMQYAAAYNQAHRTGLYVGMHDPFGSTKDIYVQGRPDQHAAVLSFEHPVPDMGRPHADFELPGLARWQLLRGDWFDAAQIYRRWASHEARWWPQIGPEGRQDTPRWMRELPVWVMTGGSPADCVPRVKAFAESIGLPAGFHWYNWHQVPFDNDYPHYFPVKDGFAEGVTELKKAGVYVMPYINGRLWDTHDRGTDDYEFTAVALPATTKDQQGHPYIETYQSKEADGNSVKLAVMCPSTPLWQHRVGDIVLRLFNEYGLNGVYIDQVAAAKPWLCFDPTHGHPLGGGHWWMTSYWQMLETIRAAKPAQTMLTTECNAEPYVRWFDGYLTWHWQYQDMVPAFPAVYGGTIQMFGRAYRAGPTQDLAHRMKAGQQLVFGEQIGWFDPGIIDRPDSGPFLRDCVRLRWRLKEYFYAGHMVRPPRLAPEVPAVTADWQWSGQWPITTKAVMTGAWSLNGGSKVVLLFANVSDQAITTRVEFDPREYGCGDPTLTVAPVTAAGSGESFTIAADHPSTEVTLAARSVLAWEIAEATDP